MDEEDYPARTSQNNSRSKSIIHQVGPSGLTYQ
jgi:hypothetical protein